MVLRILSKLVETSDNRCRGILPRRLFRGSGPKPEVVQPVYEHPQDDRRGYLIEPMVARSDESMLVQEQNT